MQIFYEKSCPIAKAPGFDSGRRKAVSSGSSGQGTISLNPSLELAVEAFPALKRHQKKIKFMPLNHEIEVKFRITDLSALTACLKSEGFRLVTPRTHEMNTLYDLADSGLRNRGALLRLRKYGDRWTVTYKDRPAIQGRHKIASRDRDDIGKRPSVGPDP